MTFSKTNKAQVWSCGGGTQSCAIAALIVQGKLPKPDFAVIADTGYETRTTWEYMDSVLKPALQEVDVDLVRIYASKLSSSPHLIHRPRVGSKHTFLHNLPVFTDRPDENQKAKLKNFCTTKWKIEVINRWLSREHGITRSRAVHWIGFSRDEQARWIKIVVSDDFKAGLTRLPLLHDCPMTRTEAVKLVEDMGWPTPPRSACYMCPNHSDGEWRDIKLNRPDEFALAVEHERAIQKTDPEVFLHGSCVPLDQVDFKQPEDLFSRPCESGMCFT